MRDNNTRERFAWLPLLLLVGIVALLAQVFPIFGDFFQQLGRQLVYYADIRNYSRNAWIGLNLLLAIGLLTIRFWPELKAALVKRYSVRQDNEQTFVPQQGGGGANEDLPKDTQHLKDLESVGIDESMGDS